jgi:cell division FtsZ-interacting protein ZapD
MFKMKTDIVKNRLYVTLEGFMNQIEMKACTDKTIEEVKRLKPGFDVISDISKLKPVGQDAIKEVERGQIYFKTAGIRHGIRVVGDAALARIQFNRIGKDINYIPDNVETVAEAENLLDTKYKGK